MSEKAAPADKRIARLMKPAREGVLAQALGG
jgi:hypothetical protein